MMSDSRCCCNCKHCIRTRNTDGLRYNKCDIDGHYIGYIETFDDWCRRWAKDHKFDYAEHMKEGEGRMIVSISKSDLELYVKVKDYEEAKLKAYHQGRADGYHKAENDYFANSQKDRDDAYNCGYEVGKADAIPEGMMLVKKDDFTEDLLNRGYSKGRLNAIYEVLGRLSKVALKSYTPNLISMDKVRDVLYQMKGETDD